MELRWDWIETGNIASSFRAIQKLDGLYKNKMIDIGVFVTSVDKAESAARIWPTSNRNGIFEELTRRNYTDQRSYPSIDIGFKPDSFSSSVDYLSANGKTYKMISSTDVIIDGVNYIKAQADDGAEKYKIKLD